MRGVVSVPVSAAMASKIRRFEPVWSAWDMFNVLPATVPSTSLDMVIWAWHR